jgi:hypothetical protein
MRVYKPFVLVTTPIALAWGVYEGFRLAGGVAVVIILQVVLLSFAFAFVTRKARLERTTKANRGVAR